ncbi:methyltransferase domain-containing protein [Aquibium sp. LZ166]|uniref:Methyltransferase domain-containing protein n=1 Tax=Aquibium pacificus TaxID=3153579 RepID=A0ABV3SRB7_9HYPH
MIKAKLDKGRPPTAAGSVTQEQVAKDFDRLTEIYERDINQAIAFAGMEHMFFIDKKRESIVRLAQERFGEIDKLDVLDLGCGLGAYHPGLEGAFRSLHGADVSARSVELAAERHPFVHYVNFDGVTLPYPDDSFDLAFTICVMHHVPPAQWDGFVAEMKRVLKPGGLALVYEHNPYNPATQYIVRSCDIDKDAVLLTPRKLRGLFGAAGFDEVQTRTIFSVPPKGALLTQIDSLFGHLPFGAQYYLSAIKAGPAGHAASV